MTQYAYPPLWLAKAVPTQKQARHISVPLLALKKGPAHLMRIEWEDTQRRASSWFCKVASTMPTFQFGGTDGIGQDYTSDDRH